MTEKKLPSSSLGDLSPFPRDNPLAVVLSAQKESALACGAPPALDTSASLGQGSDADPWADDGGVAPVQVYSRGTAIDAVTAAVDGVPAVAVSSAALATSFPSQPPREVSLATESFEGLVEAASEAFALGDFSSATERVEAALRLRPSDPRALDVLARSRETLLKMFESKLAPLDRVPKLKLPASELMWLSLDHRAGFVLSQIDGTVSYDDLLALSSMSRLDTCRILVQLCEEGVIGV